MFYMYFYTIEGAKVFDFETFCYLDFEIGLLFGNVLFNLK